MEVKGNAGSQTAYTMITRVYSPTRGSSAFAYAQTAKAQAEAIPQPQRQPVSQPRGKPAPQQKPHPKVTQSPRQRTRTQLSAGTRVSIVFCILVLSVALLFTIFRYHTISQQWAMVNNLSASIETAQLRIAELNVLVSLECAVDIQQAREAAARFGITYPEARQYVRAGDALIPESPREGMPANGENPLAGAVGGESGDGDAEKMPQSTAPQ